jgi:glycosyltransferase involved in cell wall biosynthesis
VGPWQIEQGGGGEQYKNRLVEAASELSVTFVGSIHNMDALNDEYRAAAIFAYPSVAETGETFGLAPLEAMAWGCVPIVSDLECFKDFISTGENGVSFNHRAREPARELAGALAALIEDDDLRNTLAAAALSVRETHSTRAIAKMFLDDFLSIVGSSERAAFENL